MCKSIEETTARPKFPKPKIYILNSAGCDVHLLYLIDKLSTDWQPKKQMYFDNLNKELKTVFKKNNKDLNDIS